MYGYLRRRGAEVVDGELLQQLLARGGLPAFEALELRSAAMNSLSSLRLVRRSCGSLVPLLAAGPAGWPEPEVVVADVELILPKVDVRDVGADLVEKVAIVGDDDDGCNADKELLEPGDRFHVEMVGGLVEQQDVRAAEERLGQQHAHLLAGFEVSLHLLWRELVGTPRPAEQRRRLRLGLVAVHVGELGLQLAGAHAVRFGELGLA